MTLSELGNNLYAVEVPDGTHTPLVTQPFIQQGDRRFHINWRIGENIYQGFCAFYTMLGGKKNYPQSLEIIGLSSELTEEQCKGLVEAESTHPLDVEIAVWYKNYEFDLPLFETAKESFQSLLQSKGLDLKKNYLIIKKLDA